MNKLLPLLLCLSVAVSWAEKKKNTSGAPSLNGTWCTGEDGMILAFAGSDSLRVSSSADETMGGSGKYTRTDSTFSATLVNGDMTLKMRYRYRWKGSDTVEAKATLFTINDEAVEYPEEWMSMVRCGKKKLKK